MSISISHLDSIEKDTEREQLEVRELRDRLASRLRRAEEKSQEVHNTLRTFTKKALESRHSGQVANFKDTLSFIQTKIMEEKKGTKEIESLRKHTEQLGKQLGVNEIKLKSIKQLSLQEQLKLIGKRQEHEMEEFVNIKLLKKFADEKLKTLDEIDLPKEKQFSEKSQLGEANYELQIEKPKEEIVKYYNEDQVRNPLFQGNNANQEHREFAWQDQLTQQISDSSDLQANAEAELSFKKLLEEQVAQEEQQEQKEICFNYKLSEGCLVKVSLYRRSDRDLSLTVNFPSNYKSQNYISELKARLSEVLQRSGFTLRHLKVAGNAGGIS